MEKALEILKHIEELYVIEPDLSKFEKMAQKNPERVQAWEDAFKSYDLLDVLRAIDEYWEFKNSKSKPTVAHIKALLNNKKDLMVVTPEGSPKAERYVDYANMFMARDIELGINRHLLPIYQRAVSYITQELLLQNISSKEWHQLDWSERCSKAMQLGLFNEMENVLVAICTKLYGKKYQYNEPEM